MAELERKMIPFSPRPHSPFSGDFRGFGLLSAPSEVHLQASQQHSPKVPKEENLTLKIQGGMIQHHVRGYEPRRHEKFYPEPSLHWLPTEGFQKKIIVRIRMTFVLPETFSVFSVDQLATFL